GLLVGSADDRGRPVLLVEEFTAELLASGGERVAVLDEVGVLGDARAAECGEVAVEPVAVALEPHGARDEADPLVPESQQVLRGVPPARPVGGGYRDVRFGFSAD